MPTVFAGVLATTDDWGASLDVRTVELVNWILWACFLFAFGASMGSFVNVIACRLPRGGSIVSPPSRCPCCGGMLSWRENLPVLGWLLLRGRCKRCKTPISPQYLLIELLLGLLFVGVLLTLYLPAADSWWTLGSDNWWRDRQFSGSWPGFLVVLTLLSMLVPITLIDAKTYLIPLSLTLVVAGAAAVLWPLQTTLTVGFRVPLTSPPTPLPVPSGTAAAAAFGGLAGVLVLTVLLRRGWWKASFADYDQFVREGETLGDYPHARREALREIVHLVPIAAGLAIGAVIGARVWGGAAPPDWVEALAAVSIGYLVGGGMVWITRILGTLAVGREAMGLGDVHLLAAIGAALGWHDAVTVFVVAPFSGIATAAVLGMAGWGWFGAGARALGGKAREIPYGPHLAVAAVAVVFLRPVVVEVRDIVLPPVPVRFTERAAAVSMPREIGTEPGISFDGPAHEGAGMAAG